jgi:hypothetical protein
MTSAFPQQHPTLTETETVLHFGSFSLSRIDSDADAVSTAIYREMLVSLMKV